MQHSREPTRRPTVLTIAGSDSGGGAGIQADLRTIAAHGLHGACAITALTAQNTRGVTAIHACPADIVEAQIDAAFADFAVFAIKIGMLATAPLIRQIAAALRRRPDVPVVLDPVMVASSGARLLETDATAALLSELLPRASVVTPNLPEAEAMLGSGPIDRAGMREAARSLRGLGAHAVLLKGGHLPDGALLDLLLEADGVTTFEHPRLPVEGHGTGCTLSSAIACRLALGESLADACRAACDYVHAALRGAYRPGTTALAVLDHLGAAAPTRC